VLPRLPLKLWRIGGQRGRELSASRAPLASCLWVRFRSSQGSIRFRDADDRVIYGRQGENPAQWVNSYFNGDLHSRTEQMVRQQHGPSTGRGLGNESRARSSNYTWSSSSFRGSTCANRDDKSTPAGGDARRESPALAGDGGPKRKGVPTFQVRPRIAWANPQTLDMLLRVFHDRTGSKASTRGEQVGVRVCSETSTSAQRRVWAW